MLNTGLVLFAVGTGVVVIVVAAAVVLVVLLVTVSMRGRQMRGAQRRGETRRDLDHAQERAAPPQPEGNTPGKSSGDVDPDSQMEGRKEP